MSEQPEAQHVDSTFPDHRPKKRKLRYPRASAACVFCRRRKVRCGGKLPCEVCVREEVTCEYASGDSRDEAAVSQLPSHRVSDARVTPASSRASLSAPHTAAQVVVNAVTQSEVDGGITSASSRRSSVGPPQTFMPDSHVGSNSGVSFLYHSWDRDRPNRTNDSSLTGHTEPEIDGKEPPTEAPIVSYGDGPQSENCTLASDHSFSLDQVTSLCDLYFHSIAPTYRLLHRPTVKAWATMFVANEKLSAAKQACILLICAQTLLHRSIQRETISTMGPGDIPLSALCFEKARMLLQHERGPPTLTSVQARIVMCLYLLSTFRLNECRSSFGFAVTIATALGLHRRQSSSRAKSLEAECLRRTFWCLYILDGYISVMLGQPRSFRDEDIDQPLPQNIDDQDLISEEPLENLPRHGDLEAAIMHAQLAQLLARNNDELYPLHHLSNDQMLSRSIEMLDALTAWRNELPSFLRPRKKTLTGQHTFERLNTILKLALAHVQILATRRCLLLDLGKAKSLFAHSKSDNRLHRALTECIAAIHTVLDTVETLISHNLCYSPFWSTQYIGLVGISSFYVLLIQGLRLLSTKASDVEQFLNIDTVLIKAKKCHEHLATLPPKGSQAARHHSLLSRLRAGADKRLAKWRCGPQSSVLLPCSTDVADGITDTSNDPHSRPQLSGDLISQDQLHDARDDSHCMTSTNIHDNNMTGNESSSIFASNLNGGYDVNDFSMFSMILTPNSSSDSGILDFGWESLDVIGPSTLAGHSLYDFRQY